MARKSFPEHEVAGAKRILNARKDTLDIRDRMYEPALIQLKPEIDNRSGLKILDQGEEGACTGFGLAAVINLLNLHKRDLKFKASPRMLYEMAKRHDEWPGEDYDGSSCRGAIRGWKNMGVCSEEEWSYSVEEPGELTIERAKAARSCTVGAYYRLRPEINDYHAAINEVGAIYVSADVHSGWFSPKPVKKNGLAIDILEIPDLIQSCSLMAPACSIDFYRENYEPRLNAKGKSKSNVKLPALTIYCLTDQLELDDNVAYVYRKSLLYLVSRALERKIDKPLLGMQRYSKKLAKHPGLLFNYSDGKRGVTAATSHGGFDNDLNTMNSIMEQILGHPPEKPFTESEMKGY